MQLRRRHGIELAFLKRNTFCAAENPISEGQSPSKDKGTVGHLTGPREHFRFFSSLLTLRRGIPNCKRFKKRDFPAVGIQETGGKGETIKATSPFAGSLQQPRSSRGTRNGMCLFFRQRRRQGSQEPAPVQPEAEARSRPPPGPSAPTADDARPPAPTLPRMFLTLPARPPARDLPSRPAGAAGCAHLLSCPPPDVVLGSRPPAPPPPAAPGIPGAPMPGGVPLCLSKLPGLEK